MSQDIPCVEYVLLSCEGGAGAGAGADRPVQLAQLADAELEVGDLGGQPGPAAGQRRPLRRPAPQRPLPTVGTLDQYAVSTRSAGGRQTARRAAAGHGQMRHGHSHGHGMGRHGHGHGHGLTHHCLC